MTKHSFLLAPGSWIGEGKIRLNMVDEELAFYTRWNVSDKASDGKIECFQEIQVKGLAEVMHNQFFLSAFTPHDFTMEMENHALGRVTGKGVVNDKVIGWEFRLPELGFEGFEFYEVQPDGSYLLRAEYATADQFRTLIQGKVWIHQSKDPTE